MLLVTSAYFFALPSLCYVIVRIRSFESLVSSTSRQAVWWPRYGAWLSRVPASVGLILMLVLLVGGGAAAFQLEFNDDFRTLYGKIEAQEEIKRKQSKVYTETITPASVMFAFSDEERTALVAALEDRKEKDVESPTIGRIISLQSFVPVDQPKRLGLIRESARLITPLVLKNVEDRKMRKVLRSLRDAKDLEPVTLEEVPDQIRRYFTPQDGSDARMVFIFTRDALKRRHGEEAIAFADDMDPITLGDKPTTRLGTL